MYVLNPLSIQSLPGFMSFSFFHPLCPWLKAVVAEEWGQFVLIRCRVNIGMFGYWKHFGPLVLIVVDKCPQITFQHLVGCFRWSVSL